MTLGAARDEAPGSSWLVAVGFFVPRSEPRAAAACVRRPGRRRKARCTVPVLVSRSA